MYPNVDGRTGWNFLVCSTTGKRIPGIIHNIIAKTNVSKIMAEELNGTAIEAFWAGTSFLLCSTGTIES